MVAVGKYSVKTRKSQQTKRHYGNQTQKQGKEGKVSLFCYYYYYYSFHFELIHYAACLKNAAPGVASITQNSIA